MNQISKQLAGTLILLFLVQSCGKTMNGVKNMRVIHVERTLPFPIDTVWKDIFLPFGDAHKFNPNITESGYLGETKKAVIGAERFMRNTDGGIVHERIVEIDQQTKSMRFKIFEAKDVPIDTAVTFGSSRLVDLGNGKTLFKIELQYRTSPKILAVFAHGSIKKDLENMTIGIEHYLTTYEVVTLDNFERIAKLYE